MDASKLKGMAIVSISEGATLGHIDDVLIDTKALRIDALHVKGDKQQFVVPFARIKNVGADAVTIENSQVTQAAPEGSSGSVTGLDRLKRLKVVDEAGTHLGTVSSIDVDQATGQVLGLAAHKGGLLGLGGETTLIAAGDIRSIGAEVMTVAQIQPGARAGEGPGDQGPSK